MALPQVSVIAPLFNEEESFAMLVSRLNALMDASPFSVEVVLVDDGSRDRTAELMQALALSDSRYNCVFLARNFGHQTALTAGIASARCTEAGFCIDGDLQDPPELLSEFYRLYKEGYDVVYGVRKNRKEGFVLKMLFHYYYRIQKRMTTTDIPVDSGDFALVSKRVIDVMNKMPEESRYLRGMRAWVGFKQTGYAYDRPERAAGETKYSFTKRLKFAYDGIFNFSEIPVRFISHLGFATILIALFYFGYTLFKKYVLHMDVVEGFTGLMFTIILFSGVQLLSLGVIGEYVLRIFFQVKGRPLFIIKKQIVEKQEVES